MNDERRPLGKLREHPLAALVPEMSSDEWRSFLADAQTRGILDPLHITAAGVVLDGRHRLRAARELRLADLPVRVVAPEDEVEYIVRAAALRRQLTGSQKAALAVELAGYQAERQRGRCRQRANLRNSPLDVEELPPRGARARDLSAQTVGVSGRLVQDAHTLHQHNPDLFDQVKRGELSVHKAIQQLRRNERYADITTPAALPRGRFQLIYADPPWQLGNPDSDYAPEQYYPTLPLDEICALQVPAADDALLYLWAVNSHLPEALTVMEAWGFAYRSNEVWVKPSIGMGVWTRNRHELLLIGRRGNASPAPRKQLLDSVIDAPRGRHSEKPQVVYERLEHLYPRMTKLELFARGTPRIGWTAWGNQLNEQAAA